MRQVRMKVETFSSIWLVAAVAGMSFGETVPDNAFGFRRPDPEGIEVVVNPKVEVGPVKPVHGVNNGPMKARSDQCRGNFEAYRDARIPSARTHDAVFSQAYGGAYTIDISAVFPDFDADVDDPKNYDFHYTDFTLDNIQAVGMGPTQMAIRAETVRGKLYNFER